jgi:hypothetical protein
MAKRIQMVRVKHARRLLTAMGVIGATSMAVFAGVDLRLLEGTYEVEMILFSRAASQESGPVRDLLTIRSLTLSSREATQAWVSGTRRVRR